MEDPRLRKGKCHSYIQEEQDRNYRLGQPYLSPWKADGIVNPGNLFQSREIQENHR